MRARDATPPCPTPHAQVPQYHGSFTRCVREIARREGLRGFFRFWGYDISFRVFGGAILVGYDVFQEVMRSP